MRIEILNKLSDIIKQREVEGMDVVMEKEKVKGIIGIKHIRAGEVIEEREIENIIVNVGLAQTTALLTGANTAYFNYMATGVGTTAASATNTALGSEVMRVATTNTQVTTTVTNDTAQFVATFNYTTAYAITEAGIFNASSAGTMLAHQVFSAINVASGDSLQITWKVQVT